MFRTEKQILQVIGFSPSLFCCSLLSQISEQHSRRHLESFSTPVKGMFAPSQLQKGW